MLGPIPLEEAFDDTPQFRKKLKETEAVATSLESSIKKLVDYAKDLADITKSFSQKQQDFVDVIEGLSLSEETGNNQDESLSSISAGLHKFASTFRDVERNRIMMKMSKEFKSSSDSYQSCLSRYMARRPKDGDQGLDELAQDVADARKHFHKKSIEYGSKLNELDGKRKFELIENVIALVYTNFAFFHQGYDLFKDLEPLMRELTGRPLELTDSSLIERCGAFLSYVTNMQDVLSKMRTDFKKSQATAQSQAAIFLRLRSDEEYSPAHRDHLHNLQNAPVSLSLTPSSSSNSPTSSSSPNNGTNANNNGASDGATGGGSTGGNGGGAMGAIAGAVAALAGGGVAPTSPTKPPLPPRFRGGVGGGVATSSGNGGHAAHNKSGYLYKKSTGKVRTIWNRRFFELKNDSLHYFSDTKDDSKTTIDLRICMVREVQTPERRFCFEIVSPNRSYTLQAESSHDMQEWIAALQGAIARALHYEGPASAEDAGNNEDGGVVVEGEAGSGTSIRLIKDVPVLTSMYAYYTTKLQNQQIRSITLDKWDPETIQVMLALGNERTNRIFEANLKYSADPGTLTKPDPESERSHKERWCVAKYVEKRFVHVPEDAATLSETPVHLQFVTAVKDSDIPNALRCIALGADVNERDLKGHTVLHHAVLKGDPIMADFLLQWHCDVDSVDEDGMSPLHYAADLGDMMMVAMLLRRHARCDIKDKRNKQPIDYALEKSTEGEDYVKIVTILRLTMLDMENKMDSTWRASDMGIDAAIADLKSSPKLSRGTSPPPANKRSSRNKQPAPSYVSDPSVLGPSFGDDFAAASASGVGGTLGGGRTGTAGLLPRAPSPNFPMLNPFASTTPSSVGIESGGGGNSATTTGAKKASGGVTDLFEVAAAKMGLGTGTGSLSATNRLPYEEESPWAVETAAWRDGNDPPA
ncbi:Arf-GAP with coiled-coil, ANK repeat and PH domain-containing protein 2 [Quaeritorhiza haematococci]|nr:Arf-GAP with coiled-coil, ANK repeat and PH domain-containing protein 2 [Quaeritorhiza haematococci]